MLTGLARFPRRFARDSLGRARAGAGARRSARLALAGGAFTFLLLTAMLEGGAETVRPEWRDSQYSRRIKQVLYWQRERPDRPLVLVFGSSRAQLVVSPSAMGLPDEAGSPLVCNMGIRGAVPVAVWLHFARALDDGARPRAVVLMLASDEIRTHLLPDTPPLRNSGWYSGLSATDLRRLAPFAEDRGALYTSFLWARRNPWRLRSAVVVNNLMPVFRLPVRETHSSVWERGDLYGFSPYPAERVRPGSRERQRAAFVPHQPAILDRPVGEASARVYEAILARCRAEGIAAALCWAPESPAYRAVYTAQHRAINEAFAAELSARFGVPVFPLPEHLTEEDFADPVHPVCASAEKYSRWLADNHLKPWLTQVLK